MTANAYDGKAFALQAIDDAAPGQFYVVIADGSVSPAPIRGSFHGSQYDLDPKGTGNSDDYTKGPWVGPEMLELRAKLGGAPAGTDNWPDAVPVATHDDGTPWTAAECVAFRGPIPAGPNAGPDLAPQLKQVGNVIEPVNAPDDEPAPTPPPELYHVLTTPPDQMDSSHVAQVQAAHSFLSELLDWLKARF